MGGTVRSTHILSCSLTLRAAPDYRLSYNNRNSSILWIAVRLNNVVVWTTSSCFCSQPPTFAIACGTTTPWGLGESADTNSKCPVLFFVFHVRYQPSSSSFVPVYVGIDDVPRSVILLIYVTVRFSAVQLSSVQLSSVQLSSVQLSSAQLAVMRTYFWWFGFVWGYLIINEHVYKYCSWLIHDLC